MLQRLSIIVVRILTRRLRIGWSICGGIGTKLATKGHGCLSTAPSSLCCEVQPAPLTYHPNTRVYAVSSVSMLGHAMAPLSFQEVPTSNFHHLYEVLFFLLLSVFNFLSLSTPSWQVPLASCVRRWFYFTWFSLLALLGPRCYLCDLRSKWYQ